MTNQMNTYMHSEEYTKAAIMGLNTGITSMLFAALAEEAGDLQKAKTYQSDAARSVRIVKEATAKHSLLNFIRMAF